MTIRIYQVTDVEWYAAETGEAAMAALKEASDYDDEDMADLASDGWPVEVDDGALDTMKVSPGHTDEPLVSFRQWLKYLVDEGVQFPAFFCTEEY